MSTAQSLVYQIQAASLLNKIGSYQVRQTILLLFITIPVSFNALSVVFIGKSMDHRCAAINESSLLQDLDLTHYENVTVVYGKCTISVHNGSYVVHELNCVSGFEYEEDRSHSFVSEWDLVCDKSSLSDLTQTVLSLGMTIGAFLFTALADRFGRKPIHLIAGTGALVIGIVTTFSPSYSVFVTARFVFGALHQGMALTFAILAMEVLPTDKRHFALTIASLVWSIGIVMLSGMAYLSRDLSWRYLQIAITASSIVTLFEFVFLDESIRWLIAKNRIPQAEKLLRKLMRQNKILTVHELDASHVNEMEQLPPLLQNGNEAKNEDLVDSNKCEEFLQEKQEVVASSSLWSIITNTYILKATAISCFMWFSDSLIYYGLHLTSGSLTDDFYMGVFLNSVVEMPGFLVLWFMVPRYGRRISAQICHLASGLSLLGALCFSTLEFTESVPGRATIALTFSLTGKFFISTAFAVGFLYSPELFPTNIRNTALGISSAAARLALMIAPFSRTFATHVSWGPSAIFVGLSLAVPFLLFFLPETTGKELPQSVSNMNDWVKGKARPRGGNVNGLKRDKVAHS